MNYSVYVLLNPQGKIYIGQTQNLAKRLTEHNDPNCLSTLHTKRHPGPWRLVHTETFSARADAMAREKTLKSGQGRQWIRDVLIPDPPAGGC